MRNGRHDVKARRKADTTHKCPAPDCARRVAFEQLACSRHWYALPLDLQRKVNHAWRFGSLADHARARAEAAAWMEANL